uniref:Uncharacterized protein n=1 Tax=Medicago truncatula TaxID=3880 RepID=I3SKZ3_MEDTR|nr:unknown [Medicago truncatula]
MAPSRPGNGQVTANEPRSSMIVFILCKSFSGTQRYGCPLLSMYLTLDV